MRVLRRSSRVARYVRTDNKCRFFSLPQVITSYKPTVSVVLITHSAAVTEPRAGSDRPFIKSVRRQQKAGRYRSRFCNDVFTYFLIGTLLTDNLLDTLLSLG